MATSGDFFMATDNLHRRVVIYVPKGTIFTVAR